MSCIARKTQRRVIRIFVACFAASPVTTLTISAAWSATQSEILQSCESCHGPGGDSQVATTPRLNAQQQEYLVGRLKSFSGAARRDPHADVEMFKQLSAASDAIKTSIAAYFASQPPTASRPGDHAAEGKRIYENGIAAENVIACNLCHSAQGEGHNTAPRLAGQHADYLKAQLVLFNLNFREHKVMNANTETMSQNTIDVLVSYLAND